MNSSATPLLLSVLTLAPLSLSLSGCEAAVEVEAKQHGLDMWSTPSSGGWLINFVGIKGHATDVVVRFGDSRQETYRSPSFQLPTDIKGPIDIWLLEYKLAGRVHRGPFRFRFDPSQAHVKTAKDDLDMLRTQWVTWRRYPATRDTLQTGFLSQHTCGIEKIEYGFGKEPEMVLPMPSCGDSPPGYTDLRFLANEKEHVVLRITFADGETVKRPPCASSPTQTTPPTTQRFKPSSQPRMSLRTSSPHVRPTPA